MSLLDNLKSRNTCIYKLYRYIAIYINLHVEDPHASYPLCTDLDFKSKYVSILLWQRGVPDRVGSLDAFFFFQFDNVLYNLNFLTMYIQYICFLKNISERFE